MPKLTFRAASAFDAGVASLASLSAGFVAFAMPEPILSALVSATPLPALVPPAQPPLGDTARLACVGVAAVLAFALVFALMRLLDRVPSRRRSSPAEETAGAPRLRRGDAHPDAPSRAPLLAASELGEPLELDVPEPRDEAPFEPASEPRALPSFLVPDQPVEADAAAEEIEPVEPVAAEEEPPVAQPAAEIPVPAVEPEAAPLAESAEPQPLSLAELAARLPGGDANDEQSLGQLVGRVEFGLKKRQALPRPEPVPQAVEGEEKVGHRLRSAITELQKVAGGNG